MVLEAEYNTRPSAVALLQLSRAYAELASQPVYADEQLLLVRCSLLFVSKAIAYDTDAKTCSEDSYNTAL